MRTSVAVLFALHLLFSLARAEQPLAPNAPKDKPVGATSETLSRFEKAIAPYIAEGQKTYPAARKRFLAGLPEKQIFFMTVRLTDETGKYEIVFVRVTTIDAKALEVSGRVANEISVVHGYRRGQTLALPESQVLDWTISRPNGTEEGNVVGKFLDEYQAK